MPKNLELKAKILDITVAERKAEEIGAIYQETLYQRDTYFEVSDGRLKIREIVSKPAELIFYNRKEVAAQRMSEYKIVACCDPEGIRNILTSACQVLAVVQKKRILYLKDSTRIHLDEVNELGSFIEFEVPLGSCEQDAKVMLDRLVKQFEIMSNEVILHSYSDMLLKKDYSKAKE